MRVNCSGEEDWFELSSPSKPENCGWKFMSPMPKNTTSPVSSFIIGTLIFPNPGLSWSNSLGMKATPSILDETSITFSISFCNSFAKSSSASGEFKFIPSGNWVLTSSETSSFGIVWPLLMKDFPNICAVIPPSSFDNAAIIVSKTKSPRPSPSSKISALIILLISSSSFSASSVSLSAASLFSVTGWSSSISSSWNFFSSDCGMITGSLGALFWLTSVNKYGLSNKTEPASLATSTAPGLRPKEFFGPGPINNIWLFDVSGSIAALNSVPLVPIVPAGVSTTKFSGFFSLIFPVKILILPDLIVDKSFPSVFSGS